MQDKSIFQPHLYLHLKNKKIEQNFKSYLFQQANKFTNYLLCFNFIALATSIIISIVFEIKINDKNIQTQFQSLRIISIIITIPFIATFLLKIIFPKKQIILYINILYNYFISVLCLLYYVI
jgi:ABC-type proline/glycine betaine transport system permease subunit